MKAHEAIDENSHAGLNKKLVSKEFRRNRSTHCSAVLGFGIQHEIFIGTHKHWSF